MTWPAKIKGVAASIGVAVGPARVIGLDRRAYPRRRIEESELPFEQERFRRAVSESRSDIEVAKQDLTRKHGPTFAPILDVYLLMHEDALLIGSISNTIGDERINAEWAVSRVAERLKKPLLEDSSPYFRERARDVEHVCEHLLRHLAGGRCDDAPADRPTVLIAHDLSPADAVHLLAPPTIGLVTETGAGSSHTAILARTFGVPAVVGVGALPMEIVDDEMVVVDGFSGEVTLGASLDECNAAEGRRDRFLKFLHAERSTPAVTRDGAPISVTANVELLSEVQATIDNGAEGIGLYRTEFMCLDRAEPPSEEQQLDLYLRVVRTVAPRRVVFRAFDWRGDKRLRAQDLKQHERGWLKTQIRAVLRASEEGAVAFMFPMIATLAEFLRSRALVEECKTELGPEIAGFAPVPIGMMVEVPAAALLSHRFAAHADFFAVGSNDLSHYALACDRRDGSSRANPLDPAVLELLARTVRAADAVELPCSICGDMAADPVALCLLLGLGYRQISVPVRVLPLVRPIIRNLDLRVATEVASEALGCASAEAVRELLVDRLGAELGALWRDQGIA
jgi:phosphotransferase system enzyme I (PtsI)